jgi:hypothetical protein
VEFFTEKKINASYWFCATLTRGTNLLFGKNYVGNSSPKTGNGPYIS